MGCCASTAAAKLPLVETGRRRLSIGAVDEKVSRSLNSNPMASEDRSLLVELSAQTLVDVMSKHGKVRHF